MSYTDLGVEIVNVLSTIASIKKVYDHEPKELGEYPAACTRAVGHQNAFQSTSGNKLLFKFGINCYYKLDNPQDAELILRKVADDIITVFESVDNISLNGKCEWVKPSSGQWSYGEREVPVRIVEITLEISVYKNR